MKLSIDQMRSILKMAEDNYNSNGVNIIFLTESKDGNPVVFIPMQSRNSNSPSAGGELQ